MGNQKNNKRLIVLVILLFLLVLGLGGYVVYDKVLSNKESTTNNNDNNNEIEEKLPEWAKYLLSQNITEIIYLKGKVEYDETLNEIFCTPEKKMTKEQLKDILIKMTESELKKHPSDPGRGGPCGGAIIVKYNNTEFIIWENYAIFVADNDNYIMSLFEKEKYTLIKPEFEHTRTEEWYMYDWDYSYIDTLLGES